MQVLNGFVKIHRKLLQWGWYQDNVVKGVFIHILLTASFKDTHWMGIEIKKGQVVTGTQKMANELGFTREQVRRAITKLKSTNEITTETTNKFTIITVVNWDEYQYLDEEETTNEQPTNNQQTTNKQPHRKNVKNVKECKEGKEIIYRDKSPTLKKFIPPTLEEVQAYCVERNNTVDAEKFINHYTSNGWLVGKNKMKDWKAAVRTWERSEYNKAISGNAKKQAQTEQKGSGNIFLDMLNERQQKGGFSVDS